MEKDNNSESRNFKNLFNESFHEVGSYRYEEVNIFDKKRLCNILTLKKDYIGEALISLPYGIIDKEVPGNGGTTVELNAKRNSIIVESLKYTAYSKSIQYPNSLYVGGSFMTEPSKTDIEIKKYINNKTIDNKKILVVADSIHRVLEHIPIAKRSQWFLVIDEIDSFQDDSTYRRSLEKCMDYYKEFPKENRCLITATMQNFSDDDLLEEQYTIIKSQNQRIRKVSLIHTDTINKMVVKTIVDHLREEPVKKVLVAYNSLNEIINVINDLEKSIQPENISILCSVSNNKKAGRYFSEMGDSKLPSQINFITSAYFTGYDIHEKFHCVSVSDATMSNCLLSDRKLKQIAGRGRKGLYSETIIYRCSNKNEHFEDISGEEYKKVAKSFMASMECFNNQYFGNSGEREKQVLLNQSLIKVSDFYGFQLVREDYKGKTKISFFNIDALLERNYTLKNILREKTQLGNLLKAQGVKILNWTQEYIQSEKKDKPKLSKFLKEVAIDEAVENLYKLSGEDWNKAEILNLKNSCHHSEQRRIYERCLELFNFLDKRDILKVSKYDTNRYNYYRLALSFLSRADNDPFKTAIYQNFKEDEILSSDEILLRLQKIHKQSHLGGRVHNTSEAAMREFHCYFDYKTLRKSDQKATFKIEGLNPKKIKLRQNKIPFFIDFDDLLSDDNQSTKIKELRIKPLRVTNEEDDELDINDPRMTFAK